MGNLQRYAQMAMDWAVIFLPKVLIAFVILWVGLKLVNKLNEITVKTLQARNIDATIRPFFASLVNVSLRAVLFIVVAGIFGFEITSVLALISALAFTVGLALQGSLGHFASGILLLVLKPYKVGDEIKVGEVEGFVQEIQVFNTLLLTRDHRAITIPNGVITSGNIVNMSVQGERRVDMTFLVDEPNAVATVKRVLFEAVESCPEVLKTRPTEIFLLSFNCNELQFAVRPWCLVADYWTVWATVQEAVKEGFDRAELTGNINYVQMVQHRGEVAEHHASAN